MSEICDHTSVGMFVWKRDNDGVDKLLLIERGRTPWGFAVPAGHVDSDTSYEVAAKRELKEEVGLDAKSLELMMEGRRENACRRIGGTWHYWKVYKVTVSGEITRSLDETKGAEWYTKNQIADLAKKTEKYIAGETPEEEWQKSPGLEKVMYDWVKQLKII